MKEYMKMSDAFELPVTQNNGANCLYESDGFCFADLTCDTSADYAAHAINSHDDLVAEVERLRGIIERVISTSHELAERSPTTQWGDGYKECALATGCALEDLFGKGA